MELKPLQIGNMEAEIPLIQGGMGVGISLGGLAGAVAKEGGIGIISAAQIGYREPDFDRAPLQANLRAVKQEYGKARAIAPEGIIGFNIMAAMRHYEAYVKAAIEAGADIIISGAGVPTDLPRFAAGSQVKLAPIVSTEKSARLILKYWMRKYHRLPDLLVIEGPRAGGHLGFTGPQLAAYGYGAEEGVGGGQLSYEEEIGHILRAVREYEAEAARKIPVALAGGISTAEEAARAFSLGADAIQVATRFVTTVECDADIRYKEAYLKAEKEDIMIVKSPVGMPGRAIRNPFMERVMAGEQISHSPCHGCLQKCDPAHIPYCITDALICAVKGDVDHGLLFCGADAWRAKRLETVSEVIASLFSGSVCPKR